MAMPCLPDACAVIGVVTLTGMLGESVMTVKTTPVSAAGGKTSRS
jgi:hypothetical protein